MGFEDEDNKKRELFEAKNKLESFMMMVSDRMGDSKIAENLSDEQKDAINEKVQEGIEDNEDAEADDYLEQLTELEEVFQESMGQGVGNRSNDGDESDAEDDESDLNDEL